MSLSLINQFGNNATDPTLISSPAPPPFACCPTILAINSSTSYRAIVIPAFWNHRIPPYKEMTIWLKDDKVLENTDRYYIYNADQHFALISVQLGVILISNTTNTCTHTHSHTHKRTHPHTLTHTHTWNDWSGYIAWNSLTGFHKIGGCLVNHQKEVKLSDEKFVPSVLLWIPPHLSCSPHFYQSPWRAPLPAALSPSWNWWLFAWGRFSYLESKCTIYKWIW